MKNLETKKSFSFFWKEEKGLKRDIERHRQKEKEIREKIDELQKKNDPFSIVLLSAYYSFLENLLKSKANTVTKIGKKK